MKYLATQDEFEMLIGKQDATYDLPDLTIVYFTAIWCSACTKLNIPEIQSAFAATWLKCDIDRNDYTAGYCGIRSIPTFLVVYKKKIVGKLSSSNTKEVIYWLQSINLQ
jgi:thioredoxin-like negative regulator of GroEL